MDQNTVHNIIKVAAVATAAMGGLLTVFSISVMKSITRAGGRNAIAAMQQINRTIIHPAFLLIFVSSVGSSVALLIASRKADVPRACLAGALTYLVGFLAITFAVHLPRNAALEKVDPNSHDSDATWSTFERVWTNLNHVRALASLLAAALLVSGL